MFQRYPERLGSSYSPTPSTNSTLWSLKIGGAVRSSPVVDEGLVFVGSDDFKLYCLDQNSGAVVWSFTTEGAIESSSAVFEGLVFVGSNDGKLYCLDKASGSFRWSYRTMGRVSSSPAVYGYRVVFGSENQRVYCLNAQDGTLVWSYRTEGPIHSSPAIADNRVFVGSSDGKVYCLDLVTGSPIWSFFIGASIRSSPMVSDGKVYVGASDGKIYCLNETNGDLIWSYRTEGAVESSPAYIFEGKVYVGSLDHRVYCLNGSTGSLIWSYLTGGEVWSSPAVADGKVFIGSNDGKLYCLNATTGVPVWSYDTGEAVISSPAVADGKVFVGSLSGEVYAFGVKVHSLKISATSPHLANGEDKSKVTVTALDGQGSPLAGASLILGLSMFLDHKETFIPSDLGNGTYVAYVGTVFAGEALIIVTDLVTKISEEQRNWICRCTNPFLKKVEAKHGKHSETNCTFKMFEDVYIVGAYFTPSKTMDVYLIPDGSKPVVENAIAVVTVTTDEVERIPSTYLWSVNQAGNFDIWVDYNRNGEYDYGEYIDDGEDGLYFLTSITHNIAITNVTYNYEVGIAVEIENKGESTETFWICVSYTIDEEKYPIATQQLTLPADTKTNVNFEWIPEVIGPYKLHVEVTKVLWEADLTDNVYTLTVIEAG